MITLSWPIMSRTTDSGTPAFFNHEVAVCLRLATSLQLDRHCLRRANPAACAAIANRSVTVRRTLTRSQWLLFTAAIERRCDRLRSQHEVISSRTLTAEFHKHRIFLRPSHWNYVRQKLNMVREAAREEARASPTSAERRFN
jgi:hypothetical protein